MIKTRIGYQPGTQVSNNVISYIEAHMSEFPERIALRWAVPGAIAGWDGSEKTEFAHQEINYKDFALRIRHFAQGLLGLGVKKGERVIIFLPMGLDMYTAMFAVQRIGAIAVFLDSWARASHLGASAECVNPKAMISFKPAFDLVAQVPEFSKMPLKILWGPGEGFQHRFDTLLATQDEAPIAAVESEFTALITFTTGSSGTPKGANRTHRFLSAQHEALDTVIPYTSADRDLPAFPIFSLNNLAAGVTTILPALDLAKPSERDPEILVSQILSQKVSCATLSPSMLVGVAKSCHRTQTKMTGLRRVVTGGAPISKDDVKSFVEIAPNAELWVLYGSTEVEPMAHIEGHAWLAQKPKHNDPEILEEGVNVGHIDSNLDFKFIKISKDPVDISKTPWNQIELKKGEIGEFIVSGDHVCRDYYNNPDAFFKAKIKGEDGRVWHRTGDLAYIDGEGYLWMVGRIHNAIERAGKYYFPVRPEVLLKRMAFTEQAAYLGLPDAKLVEKTSVALKLKNGIDLKSVVAEIQRVFSKNQIPVDEIHIVDSVPMDPRHHSKVEYTVLKESILAGKSQKVFST
ncbi:MAG: AMP-binding protein [Bdellovibrionota bacterium]